MKKFINDQELLNRFIEDSKTHTRKKLSELYEISLSSVKRILKQCEMENNDNESQVQSEKSSRRSSIQSKRSIQGPQNSTIDLQNEPIDLQNESIDLQNESIDLQNKSLEPKKQQVETKQQDEPINESYVSIKWNVKEDSLIKFMDEPGELVSSPNIKEQNQIKKEVQKELQKQIKTQTQKQQQIEIIPQIEIKPQPCDQQNPEEIDNYIVKIRKMIQFFKDQTCIHSIIGQTETQQRHFNTNLHVKNLEEVKLLYKRIQFELLFSKSNTFIQDSIEQAAVYGEQGLSLIGIDVVGCYDEMKQDEDFQFYMNMLICDSSYIPSAKQIIFMKFVKNYYMRFNEGKKSINEKQKDKMKEKVSEDILAKFNQL